MQAFITATMITTRLCSPNRDGQELLPELVAKLIRASIPGEAIRKFRFPHGDQIYLHGPDGVLAVDDTTLDLHVPSGISLWEMGTSMHPKKKADDDFREAPKKLASAFPNMTPIVTPDKATFVFVTSTAWDAGGWIKEKRSSSNWKCISVLDAVTLAEWLEQCPAIMLWFARVCGVPAEGLYDAEQYLSKLGTAFGISPIFPETFLAGRDEDLESLDKLLLQSNAEVHIRGESMEEAAAFLAAASLKDPDRYSKKPPLIFADGGADLNLLVTSGKALMLVPTDSDALARAKSIPGHTWRLVLPEVASLAPLRNEETSLALRRCKRAAVEQHLVEQMKVPEHKAQEIARDTKGSLVALLWLIGSGPIGVPRWATRKDATTHASLMLAGSWVGSNGNDTDIIARLSRKDYRDIETLLQSAEIPEGPWVHRGTEWTCASRDFVWSQLARRVTETMLKDFREIVGEVVGEEDPSLELSSSDRPMANLLGKTRKYSSSLRRGLVDSVARLAVATPDGQGWADRIVRDILDPEGPEAPKRWLGLADVYSEVAEASPDMFLGTLDAVIRSEGAKQFFQDAKGADVMFGPTSAHVYLLWALERLAWQREYFSRVLSALAGLAEIDPDGSTGNSPKNSLITILLPWCPQHMETMGNAARALGMLYSRSPAVAWDVALALLPTLHGFTSPTPTPTYREHPGKRNITGEEYWGFIREVVEMMTTWAGHDAARWCGFIQAYPETRCRNPEVGQLITDALGNVEVAGLAESDKAAIHDTMRDLVSRHHEFSDAKWTLRNSDLELLAQLQERFRPRDVVLQYSYLFSWTPHAPNPPMKQYEDGWDEWLAGERVQAARAVYAQEGWPGLARLSEAAVLPGCVGQAIAELELSAADVARLMTRGLFGAPGDYADSSMAKMARAYVGSKYRSGGKTWLDGLLQHPEMSWTSEAYANLALGLPGSPTLWERLSVWGEDADRLYWKNVEIRRAAQEHWQEVLDKWKTVGRPWASLELLAALISGRRAEDSVKKPSAGHVIEVLESALQTDESVEQCRQQGAMLSYHVEHLFLFLDSEAVNPVRIARLEWGWLRVLEDTKRGIRALQEQVTSSPEVFVDLLKALFRRKGEPETDDVPDGRRRIAGQAFRLLDGINTVPGYRTGDAGEAVDPNRLREWVRRSRRLAQEAGRLSVCDSRIGHILSYSPESPDGSWPCQEVRDLIEEVQSPDLEQGLRIGKYNQRGAHFRAPGGKQEWELAKKYRELADKVRSACPRTVGILEGLARGYEDEAAHWDEAAKRDEYER